MGVGCVVCFVRVVGMVVVVCFCDASCSADWRLIAMRWRRWLMMPCMRHALAAAGMQSHMPAVANEFTHPECIYMGLIAGQDKFMPVLEQPQFIVFM